MRALSIAGFCIFAALEASAQVSPTDLLRETLDGQNPADRRVMLWKAQELEEAGETLRAWLAYTHLAGLDPTDRVAAGKSIQLRTAALAKATLQSNIALPPEADPALRISDEEWKESQRLLPPPLLQPKPGRLSLRMQGDAKALIGKVLERFGIEFVFDGDYEDRGGLQIAIEDADFEGAVYALGLATGSFLVPLSPKLALVVRDTEQKRREQERTVAITLPIPTAISSPEAQELGRAVQQMFELQKTQIDSTRGTMLIRDRWSKVRLAEAALSQLLNLRGQVMIEAELYEINEQTSMSFGFSLPTASQLIPLVSNRKLILPAVSGNVTALGFGGGATLFGLGVTTARIFASMTYSHVSSLYRAQLRSLDGLAASLHIGDRFPIVTSIIQTSFDNGGAANPLANAPQIQFEDLGITLKVTPHLHGGNEVTLDVESEFKILTGQTNNDIPVIANRKYTGTVRLKEGEWAVAAGLVTRNEARTITGLMGLSQIPLLGRALSNNGREKTSGQTLLILRPRIIAPPASDYAAKEIFTGTELKYVTPLSVKPN